MGCRPASACDGLFIRKSRLAEVHVHVGEAGKKSILIGGDDPVEIEYMASELKHVVNNGNILFPDIAVTVNIDIGE